MARQKNPAQGGLNPTPEKARLFAESYIQDFHITKAAMAAGYSERTALKMGYTLPEHPLVMKEVAKAMEARAKRVQYDADRLLQDMVDVFQVAKRAAMEGDPQAINAFRGMTDTMGKHVNVQAWNEKLDVSVEVKDPAEVLEAAQRRLRERRKKSG